jgi:imidazolonepropionase-like amidohydrolase
MAPAQKKIIIENVRIFDGYRVTKAQTIVIDGEVIGSDSEGADEVIDGEDGVLLPGLIDAHIHLHHEGHLRELAKFGVTTGLDMAAWPAEKINGLRGKAGLTDIRSAGLPVTAAGSIHSCMLPLPAEALLSGPNEAEAFVKARVAEGSDYIKLISDVPGPKQETLNAVTAAAHQFQKKVVAHASAYIPFQMALEAGADIITHVPRDKIVDGAVVDTMVAKKVVSVPTLTMMKETSKKPPLSAIFRLLTKPTLFAAIVRSKTSGVGEQTYQNARESVTNMYRGGVFILAGTDCHEEPSSIFSVKHGDSLHRELELLVEAGLSTVDALRAATILPAECFNLLDRGAIEVGKRADIVLLRDDPVKDIRATRNIVRVWCAGVEYPSVA